MKKALALLLGFAMMATVVVIPAKETKAATDGYVLRQQAQDLYNQALRERDYARRDKDNAKDRVNDLRNRGISGDQLNDALRKLDECYRAVDRKEDKVSRAGYVLDFVNSRNESEIFLAGMQEKFKNQASLKPMQDKIDGANAIISAQTSQIKIIQDAIKSQTALAQVNPAIFAQVQELNNAYQQELAQLKAEQEEVVHLQAEYNAFASTMPMPTAADYMRLSEIRYDFQSCCREFDAACAE